MNIVGVILSQIITKRAIWTYIQWDFKIHVNYSFGIIYKRYTIFHNQ